MSHYDVPDSHDPEWQSQMLRELEENLKLLQDEFDEDGNVSLDDALAIVDALRQYSGY